ncbi:MAG: acyl carrier protein [Lachnospiraceae bacterium]|nr:acyl carrier protein [Lachnospiraceae bacterium]
MVVMTKYDLEPITKTFYQALEEGTVLGRKCTKCGHIEFPPYLCCNSCGGLDTEWVDLTNMRGMVKQALPTKGAFGDPDFRKEHGDYFAVEIVVDGADPVSTSLLHVDYDKYDEFDKLVRTEEVLAKPLIIQDEDTKVVVWELDGHEEFKKLPEMKAEKKQEFQEAKAEEAKPAKAKARAAETAPVDDEVARTVFACAAEAYGVDESELTLETDIREDLANESMKMIVMISQIEDELDVEIEIQEASLLNTLEDFINKVKEKM